MEVIKDPENEGKFIIDFEDAMVKIPYDEQCLFRKIFNWDVVSYIKASKGGCVNLAWGSPEYEKIMRGRK